ncbi:MAG: TIGR03619 family F420-dependent LLM class oxidoreductase [Actinobacteria bacterium]|nr:TIGR03619 family F420-dependent LLM class oxidoreductase [Actinomycetota bacterium]MCL5444783.1 TIGR03619 family F420-dependent LLM class oxidoreductase [Actinomycetota bacterium]
MGLKLGIVTPIIHMNPRFEPPGWEETGSVEDILTVARAAERAGYDWVSASEHIAVPLEATSVRGGRYWDPITTLAVISQATERIRLLTHMAVLPYHHPLELVKRMGTLDVVSNGRVVLGVGVGSLEPEFNVLGHRFEGRGERSDDAIRAIRSAWGVRVPNYSGTHYQFSGFVVEPSGLARNLAIWVGGRSLRSLRRAIELGQAWMPFRLTLEELGSMLARPNVVALLDEREERGEPLDLILAPEPPIDPLARREETLELLRAYRSIGATGFSLRFRHESRTHFLEQMEATVELARLVAG